MNKFLPLFTILIIVLVSFAAQEFLNQPEQVQAASSSVWQSCESGSLYGPYNWNYFMGYKFRPNQDGQITELCAYVSGTKTVKLQDSSFNVLASASVTASGNWSCSSISPVDVNGGSYYYVGVDLNGSGVYIRTGLNLPKTCNDVYIAESCYQSGASEFSYPSRCYTSYMYGMADIKISFNQSPAADFGYSPSSPTTADTIQFDASASSDPDGNITDYQWDWTSDGSWDATGQTAAHSYSSSGDHDVTLQVTDNDGATDSTTQTVSVSAAPQISVETNSATNVQSGQATLNGTLTDLGGNSSVEVWFEWGTDTSYGNSTSHQTKTNTGDFTATIVTGLNPETTYHFRAVAQ